MNTLIFKGRYKTDTGEQAIFGPKTNRISDAFKKVWEKFTGKREDLSQHVYHDETCVVNNEPMRLNVGDRNVTIPAGTNWFLTFDNKFGPLLRAEGYMASINGLSGREIAEKFSMGPEHMNTRVFHFVENDKPMSNMEDDFPAGTRFVVTDRYYNTVTGKICVDLATVGTGPNPKQITEVGLNEMKISPAQDREMEMAGPRM